MTSVGFDKPLDILPFDHRGSFQSGGLPRRVGEGRLHQLRAGIATEQAAVHCFVRLLAAYRLMLSMEHERLGLSLNELL